ncbi:MAG: hypothetical protein ACR2JB_15865 [Bryobacteraceae bacterium]
MGNRAESGNMLEAVVRDLVKRLPSGWRIRTFQTMARRASATPGFDAVLRIRNPRGETGLVLVELKRHLEPKNVDNLTPIPANAKNSPVLVVAPFISARTRERLKSDGFGYADLTGNVRLSLPKPGLFIETSGAVQNPVPTAHERKSLKGAKAGRLIRALCDFRPPLGLRELAKRAGVDPGYASRIIDFLNREALVTRQERGPISNTDWPALIRRWSQEYSPFQPARVAWYLAPRGLAHTTERLKTLSSRYVVSGSWAAAQFAPVSPSRLLLCYADDVPAIARALEIRPAEAGANIALVTPFDPVVYERTSQQKGIVVAAVSQITVDLLGSPGRGPNEAEALIEWMRDNEDAWRA